MYDDDHKRVQFGVENNFPLNGPELRFLAKHVYQFFKRAINGKVSKPLAEYLKMDDGKEMQRLVLECGEWNDG